VRIGSTTGGYVSCWPVIRPTASGSPRWVRVRRPKGETLLLAAWDAERRKDPWDEQAYWEHYARHLIREGSEDTPESEHALRIALALRRCDQLANVLGREDSPSDDPEDLDTLVAGQLEESLTWDPDDRDTSHIYSDAQTVGCRALFRLAGKMSTVMEKLRAKTQYQLAICSRLGLNPHLPRSKLVRTVSVADGCR